MHSPCPRHELLPRDPCQGLHTPTSCPAPNQSTQPAQRRAHDTLSQWASPLPQCQDQPYSQPLPIPAFANPSRGVSPCQSQPSPAPKQVQSPPSPPVEGLIFPLLHLIQRWPQTSVRLLSPRPENLPPDKSRSTPGPQMPSPAAPHTPMRLCPQSHTFPTPPLREHSPSHSHAAQPTGQAPRPHPGPSHPSHCHHPQSRSPSPSAIVVSTPTTPPTGEPPGPPPALGTVSPPKPSSTCPPSGLPAPSHRGSSKAQRPGVPRKARGAPEASPSPDPGLREGPRNL